MIFLWICLFVGPSSFNSQFTRLEEIKPLDCSLCHKTARWFHVSHSSCPLPSDELMNTQRRQEMFFPVCFTPCRLWLAAFFSRGFCAIGWIRTEVLAASSSTRFYTKTHLVIISSASVAKTWKARIRPDHSGALSHLFFKVGAVSESTTRRTAFGTSCRYPVSGLKCCNPAGPLPIYIQCMRFMICVEFLRTSLFYSCTTTNILFLMGLYEEHAKYYSNYVVNFRVGTWKSFKMELSFIMDKFCYRQRFA